MGEAAPMTRDRTLFLRGENRSAWKLLGAHPAPDAGADMWRFAVWAPHARQVSVVGDFNAWDSAALPMTRGEDGIWTTLAPVASLPAAYRYAVEGEDGQRLEHADPYAPRMALKPRTASVLAEAPDYGWQDAEWMRKRASRDPHTGPMNIYEVHLGSWKRVGSQKDGSGRGGSTAGQDAAGRMLTWAELADELIPYALDMGYTHLEFLPVMEHPYTGSWGYQVGSWFAPTGRHGDPEGLKLLIDRCHQAGLGVILDWVPAHFPRDKAGLRRFDGSALYEADDPRRSEFPQWGTCLFDFSKGGVRSFLLSSACWWLGEYHADGLRVDAVSAILYHDFCRDEGQWLPNRLGGRENLEGIDFLQHLTCAVHEDFPGALIIAEESHAFPGVTHSPGVGGLGFDYKWNMGWSNDTLAYAGTDFPQRRGLHDKVTFSLVYAFDDRFILPLSHDEVTRGKKSLLDKQPGDIWQKFAGLRALYGYAMAHPGRKLLFMGGEFGQFIEWCDGDQLDWFLLVYDMHPQLKDCVREMNWLYRRTAALWEIDESWDGFQWIQADDRENEVYAFLRRDKAGNALLSVTNFTPDFHPRYRLGPPAAGRLTELFNTDSPAYGGSGQRNPETVHTDPGLWNGFEHSAELLIPPLATVWFSYQPDAS